LPLDRFAGCQTYDCLTTTAVAVEGSGGGTELLSPPGNGVHVKRHRCAMTAMVAISVAASAACGGGSTSFQPPPVQPPPVHAPPVETSASSPALTSTASAAAGEVRLGCGTHCQSAGGYGAPGVPNELDVIKVVGGAVSLDPDGYVPVAVTCLVPTTCRGVLLLDVAGYTPPLSYTRVEYAGRSDLVVDASSTETIGVPLVPDALAIARANSPVTVHVSGDTNATAPCSQIPQLAATCAQIVAADPRHIGDGLQHLFGGTLEVSANQGTSPPAFLPPAPQPIQPGPPNPNNTDCPGFTVTC